MHYYFAPNGSSRQAVVAMHGHSPCRPPGRYDAARRSKQAGSQWRQQHMTSMMAKSFKWWEAQNIDDQLVICFPGLACLNDREAELLMMQEVKFPEAKMRVVELSQSFNRCKVSSGKIFQKSEHFSYKSAFLSYTARPTQNIAP